MSEAKVGYTVSVKDKEESPTGALRNSRRAKGRFDLISLPCLVRLAFRLEEGAVIYGDRNWEKGMPLSRFLDGALRHLVQAAAGMDDEDHLAGALFNIMCWMHGEQMIKAGRWPDEYADLPKHPEVASLFKEYLNAIREMS